MLSHTARANLPLGKSASNYSTERCRKSPITRSNQMEMMKIPSKMKTSATVAIMELPMLTLKVFIALQLQIERNPPFKKHKKFLVNNSDMQKAETNFLRAMKGYGENEK